MDASLLAMSRSDMTLVVMGASIRVFGVRVPVTTTWSRVTGFSSREKFPSLLPSGFTRRDWVMKPMNDATIVWLELSGISRT